MHYRACIPVIREGAQRRVRVYSETGQQFNAVLRTDDVHPDDLQSVRNRAAWECQVGWKERKQI